MAGNLSDPLSDSPPDGAYAAAGVNIDAGNQAVALMGESVRSTYDQRVLAGIGAFGGLFDAAELAAMRAPVLVASTDGVGTKVKLAAQMRRFESIGHDIVNHCVNDILVQGARPLFFLDYIASSSLEPQMVAAIVAGVAEACRASKCVLLGGETAEMPGVYRDAEFDVAGTIVGVVEREHILPAKDILAGDVLIGLRSSGPHTNGFSLIRRALAGIAMDQVLVTAGLTIADALLAPHRSYLPVLEPILAMPDSPVKALAHLTGGGFVENIPRVLPDGLNANVETTAWEPPEVFRLIQAHGKIDPAEMYRVFNMGIGMVVVVAPERLAQLQAILPEDSVLLGSLMPGERGVTLAGLAAQ